MAVRSSFLRDLLHWTVLTSRMAFATELEQMQARQVQVLTLNRLHV